MLIGIDTNILVRYFADDDPSQFRRAETLIDSLTYEDPGFISLVTVAELVWVMRSRYRLTKPQLGALLDMLLRTRGFLLENAEIVSEAVRLFARSKADFADCLIARSGAKAGCAYTATFDEQAAQGAGMRLVP